MDDINSYDDDQFDYGYDECGYEEDDEDESEIEKNLKEITEYIKDEYPVIYADMVLKDIIK